MPLRTPTSKQRETLAKVKTVSLSSGAGSREEHITVGGSFERLILGVIERPNDSYRVVETIILAHQLVEVVIKERLRIVNPALVLDRIDPEDIARVSGKESRLLNRGGNRDVKSAGFSVLLQRLTKFENVTKYQKSLVDLAQIRNRIVHASKDVELELQNLKILLSRYIFPFLKVYIAIPNDLWVDFGKIQRLIHDKFAAELARKIIFHRREARGLHASVISNKIEAGPDIDDATAMGGETEEFSRLACPACGHNSTSIVSGFECLDADCGGAGTWSYSICTVCGLELRDPEQDELFLHPTKYFPVDADVESWYEALSSRERDWLEYI